MSVSCLQSRSRAALVLPNVTQNFFLIQFPHLNRRDVGMQQDFLAVHDLHCSDELVRNGAGGGRDFATALFLFEVFDIHQNRVGWLRRTKVWFGSMGLIFPDTKDRHYYR